jgi:hypothetical protein
MSPNLTAVGTKPEARTKARQPALHSGRKDGGPLTTRV